MPRTSNAARIATAATKAALEAVEERDEDEERGGVKTSPFFANLEQEESQLDNVAVSRMGPVGEGHLGKIGATDGEEEILKRWGGGKYKLIGRDERNRPMKGAFHTIDVAGEPKFKTKLAAQEYARMQRESNGEGGVELVPAASKGSNGSEALGIKDVLVLMDRRRDESSTAHTREMERLRLEGEMRERERKAENDRLREERRADDERRRQDAHDREERDRKHAEEQTRRDREFYANMLKMGQGSHAADPMAAMTTGINLAVKLLAGKEGGDGDPVSAFVKAMPEMMKHGADMFKTGGAPPTGAAPASGAARAPDPREGKKGEVTLAGEIGKKAEKVVEHLVAQQFDVEAMLSQMFDALLSARNPNLPQNAKPAQPAAQTPPAPEKKPEVAAAPPAAQSDGAAPLPPEPASPPRAANVTPAARSATP